MRKIEIRNKIAIYLDHRELINDMYNKDVSRENGEETFQMRAELFDFRERKMRQNNAKDHPESQDTESGDGECSSSAAKKSIKTKKRKINKMCAITELENVQNMADDCVQQLQQHNLFECAINQANIDPIPRYWEDVSVEDFPKFNGANTTTSYQHCRFGSHSYLIPPQCRFFNYDVLELQKLIPQLKPITDSQGFDLVVLDPPWRNKYIRRLKRVRRELGYQMLGTEQMRQIPLEQLIHKQSLVAIWCTNCKEIQRAIVEDLLPAWNLNLQHKLHWLKLNTSGNLITDIDTTGVRKQPFEMLYIASHKGNTHNFSNSLQQVEAIMSVPSIVHSHKPPLLPWLADGVLENVAQPKCLEIFARYLQPHFTSIGLEVLKLMDERLYQKTSGTNLI